MIFQLLRAVSRKGTTSSKAFRCAFERQKKKKKFERYAYKISLAEVFKSERRRRMFLVA